MKMTITVRRGTVLSQAALVSEWAISPQAPDTRSADNNGLNAGVVDLWPGSGTGCGSIVVARPGSLAYLPLSRSAM